ncbi:hypothetical protein GMD78_20970 [Ornithinibacillus sp. L9]|uniref:Uncharacterized protein n=1 Tax=Ornithinibacillus caprae TaxID=2678566 RepID=A0A6N8FQ10_9BACI|nr:hypothetical protein [Ornithinibacillus caprae]MUK90824.1 hypothetical protein [Ornithinibacillus caprae]
MRKKYTILIICLTIFLVLVYILNNPSINDNNFNEENNNDQETAKVKNDVNLIENLNLEAENRKLKEEIDLLQSDLFEYKKALISPESNDIALYYESLNPLYKKVTDNKIILLVRNETDDGYRLTISSKEKVLFDNLPDLKNSEIINYTGANGFYSGLIEGNEVNTVTVKENEKSYEAKIVNFTDNISFWYTIYEHKLKSTKDTPDKMKIEAYDKNGNIIWEKSFDGNLGR